MSETRFESDLVKSLEKLDEILTKSQIGITGHTGDEPEEWEGGDVTHYDTDKDAKWVDEDHVTEGGDYEPKKVKKAYDDDETGEEKKRGKIERDQWERGEQEGKKLARRDEEEDEEEDDVKKGVEVSEFLAELTKSIARYSSYLEDYVEKSILQLHEEHGGMAKAIAENLVTLSGMIQKSEGNISDFAEEPTRAPKSMMSLEKSVDDEEVPQLSHDNILNRLVKGVEDGVVSPLEVIKFEQLGPQALNQDVVKSLLAS
jgi:hypothetical protein